MIIAVVNSKGGVGKSTISVHLAAWLHEQGHRVLLADCDAQQSSSNWAHEAIPELPTVCFSNADEVFERLPKLSKDVDFVVADGPGSNNDTSRALLLCADRGIVPCKASMLEIRALSEATAILRHAQLVRRGLPKATIVLSMIGKNYRLTKDMQDAAKALKLPVATGALTLRQVYADAPGQATVVWKMGSRSSDAAREVRHLIQELLPEARRVRRPVEKPRLQRVRGGGHG
jgi:chromosome partitioning protein